MEPRAPSSTIGLLTRVLRLRCRRAPAARILRSTSSQRDNATSALRPPSPATVTYCSHRKTGCGILPRCESSCSTIRERNSYCYFHTRWCLCHAFGNHDLLCNRSLYAELGGPTSADIDAQTKLCSRLVMLVRANIPQGSRRLSLCSKTPELYQPQQGLKPSSADNVVVSVFVRTEFAVYDRSVVLTFVVQRCSHE